MTLDLTSTTFTRAISAQKHGKLTLEPSAQLRKNLHPCIPRIICQALVHTNQLALFQASLQSRKLKDRKLE